MRTNASWFGRFLCLMFALCGGQVAQAFSLHERPVEENVTSLSDLHTLSGVPVMQPLSAEHLGDDVLVFPMLLAGPAVNQLYQSRFVALAAVGGIAIVYPDIGEPFRSVFMQIIDGIESRANGRVVNFPVKDNANPSELIGNLKSQNTKTVIALGQHGVRLASQLDDHFAVIAGGILDYQDGLSRNMQINSLSPDPALLFARLKIFVPKVQKIYAVYNPKQSGWIIQLAKTAAKAQGLTLVTYEAPSIKDAVSSYQEILDKMDGQYDALWLLQDPTVVDERTVLPLVLQASWDKNLPVFSSNFSHVKRGVLFSLYPNNAALGRYLASSAIEFMNNAGREVSGMLPLREVLVAVNIRTGRHLGLELNQSSQSFDIAFPER